MKKITTTIAALSTIALLAACESGEPKKETAAQENATSEAALSQFLKAQPAPQFTWSQLRQNLIEIQTAQANSTATTSFFFNQGVGDPVMECPSIGFAIPATYQLTNPVQPLEVGVVGDPNPVIAIDQLEATGVYTADTSGTYAICVDETGDAYAFYWEGFVSTVTGPARWDSDAKRIVLTGAPSAEFSTEK